MINIGQKVRFVPCWNKRVYDTKEEIRLKSIIGKVIYVDRAHKTFTVRYSCGGTIQKETFKFSDLDKEVLVVGGVRHG